MSKPPPAGTLNAEAGTLNAEMGTLNAEMGTLNAHTTAAARALNRPG
ncbi:hypothetical protein [Gordonia sp. NPDC003429]